MTYKEWFINHGNKHKKIVEKLQNLSNDEIIDYFRFENMQKNEPDFCLLYKENKKGDLEIMQLYGLPKFKWYKEDEELYPDTVKVLERLSKSYKIGVIANQSLGTAGRLEEKGILQYIDLVIASAEEGVSKPDKKIFDIALSRANCEAGNAVMIGDRIDNDIVPAKKIGMKTIWIKQGFGKYWRISNQEEQADYEVDNLTDLLELLG